MITGSVQCDTYEEAKFFDIIIEVGLLNINMDIKEKFKDTKIRIKAEFDNNKEKETVKGSE